MIGSTFRDVLWRPRYRDGSLTSTAWATCTGRPADIILISWAWPLIVSFATVARGLPVRPGRSRIRLAGRSNDHATATPDAPREGALPQVDQTPGVYRFHGEQARRLRRLPAADSALAFSFIGPMFYVTDRFHADLSILSDGAIDSHPLGTDRIRPASDASQRAARPRSSSACSPASSRRSAPCTAHRRLRRWLDRRHDHDAIVDARCSSSCSSTRGPPTVPVHSHHHVGPVCTGTSRLIRARPCPCAREVRRRDARHGQVDAPVIRTHIVHASSSARPSRSPTQSSSPTCRSRSGRAAPPPTGAMLSSQSPSTRTLVAALPPGVLIILLVLSDSYWRRPA